MSSPATRVRGLADYSILELLPYLLAISLVAATLILGVLKVSGVLGAPASEVSVVTFDVVKYTNATRAVASSFLKPGTMDGEAGALLMDLPERTRAAIEREAGPGTLVMVKQGVVQGQTRDITDAVLKALGLPTYVPTQDNAAAALDAAPTMLHGWPAPSPRPSIAAPGGTVVLP